MATIIKWTWTITDLSVSPITTDKPNEVILAHWYLAGNDGSRNAQTHGYQSFEYTGGAFTPFEQLTEQQIIDWVKEALTPEGVKAAEDRVQAFINSAPTSRINLIPKLLPWVSAENGENISQIRSAIK